MNLKEKYGEWALITGASSGIGKEFATQLAAKGLHVVLVARRLEKLQLLAKDLETQYAIKTLVIEADLCNNNFLATILEKLNVLNISVLINNAGFGTTGPFLEQDIDRQIQMIDLNCKVPIILAHHFGKAMKEQKKGLIINIASSAAFLPMPLWSNYAATKAYLMQFSNALAYELKASGVDVMALCPSATKTEFGEVAKAGKLNKNAMEVEDVVSEAIAKAGKTNTLISGMSNKIKMAMLNFLPLNLKTKIGAMAVETMA